MPSYSTVCTRLGSKPEVPDPRSVVSAYIIACIFYLDWVKVGSCTLSITMIMLQLRWVLAFSFDVLFRCIGSSRRKQLSFSSCMKLIYLPLGLTTVRRLIECGQWWCLVQFSMDEQIDDKPQAQFYSGAPTPHIQVVASHITKL